MKFPGHLKILILLPILFTGGSCDNEEETVKYEGETVISSEIIQKDVNMYIVYGFSFEKGENIPYYLTSSSPPDIIVTKLADFLNDSITGAVLNSPENEEAFYLNRTDRSYSEAKEWFDNYSEVTATDFIPLADSVELYQIWTIQTSAGKFAKLLIKKIEIVRNNPGSVQDYVDITIDYEYQPDGSRTFRENRSGN